jgi:DNA-binding winged helix-turn-helix (wHTH) protein
MASEPAGVEQPIRFGEGFEVDLRPRRLRRGSHVLKLERIPFEILLLLLELPDEIVTRDQIVSRVRGQGVFLDADNSIRSAIRKLRQVLKDDAQTPRFIQTVTGQGYRFVALVTTPNEPGATSEPEAAGVPTIAYRRARLGSPGGKDDGCRNRSPLRSPDRIAHELETISMERYVSPYGLA